MKTIITDLDRTLLRTDKTVSEYTYSVLKQCHERGILLMAATARPERAVLDYRDQIGFEAMVFFQMCRYRSGMRRFFVTFLRCQRTV